MKATSIAVLRGGPSAEYDVSMQTGAGVLAALASTKHQVKDIVITRSGEWLVGGYTKRPEEALFNVDVVFIALHGAYGEDGTVQRILDRLNVPYTGSAPYPSALAMNKIIAKDHLKDLGIRMPRHVHVLKERTADPVKVAMGVAELFGPHYVIKPVSGGSSIGTSIAHNPHELGSLLAKTLEEHDELMIEEMVRGTEATMGVLENYRGEQYYTMPAVEILPPEESGFFAADVKYNGTTTEICPGRFTRAQKEELARAATLIHKTLGLRHYSRSDFILAPEGVYFLEVNTLPGLTSESLFPKSMDAVGGSFLELIEHLISNATGRS